jgi:hypothetical protein
VIPRWANLSASDRNAFLAARAFLERRLDRKETIEWALALAPTETAKRIAILELLDGPIAQDLKEPWLTAWRLIQESWDSPARDRRDQTEVYHIQRLLKSGDRSGVIIDRIEDMVRPRLKVDSFNTRLIHPSLTAS